MPETYQTRDEDEVKKSAFSLQFRGSGGSQPTFYIRLTPGTGRLLGGRGDFGARSKASMGRFALPQTTAAGATVRRPFLALAAGWSGQLRAEGLGRRARRLGMLA